MIKNKVCNIIVVTKEKSTRLKMKNLLPCAGKPLAFWALEQCFKSKYADTVYHCTNSKNMAKIFERKGCVTIEEPYYLLKKDVQILDVIKYAAQKIKGYYFVWVDLSKPLTKAWQIDEVIRKAHKEQADSVFTVKRLYRSLVGDPATLTQDNIVRYTNFGAVRLRTYDTIINAEKGTWGTGAKHIDLPICKDWEIDVDYYHDLIMAEALLKNGY
jgi:CMP-N-acetylneuraminic acid synthetase